MRRLITFVFAIFVVSGQFVSAQEPIAKTTPEPYTTPPGAAASIQKGQTDQLREEIEAMKKTIATLEERLAAQEKKQEEQAPQAEVTATAVKELDRRVAKAERDSALDRVNFSGDYRFETHTINGDIPAYYNGLEFQNLLVGALFTYNTTGAPPSSIDQINSTIAQNYSNYQYFTQNLSFSQLKAAVGQIPPELQQQLFGMLLPATYQQAYSADNGIMYTNRFRLKIDSQLADNISVTARLSMYKVFGDSTGVQVFNGQPTSLNIDGTTVGVPSGDFLRVERAYFTWNKINGSNFFLSIGRRPSTEGPPLEYREDEPRAGTPSGALINYQFDGITFGYHLGENTALRLCYGLGYESGFGNGDLLKPPQDRLSDAQFLGANVDIWNSDNTLVQATYARAFDVTDGFNGLVVLPYNPLTGEAINAPVVLRYTPSANLGAINLAGVNVEHRFSRFDTFISANYVGFQPNQVTTPFGGLVCDPFEVPENHSGGMIYGGVRFRFGEDDRTKIGFEANYGSKYWFNFAQAEDDILAPKTNTRGEAYEWYLTHRITNRFIFKADYTFYNYRYSGSGWHVGAPKLLSDTPMLGFPTYSQAGVLTFGIIARF